MPSAVYFTLGAGSTRFAGDDHFTVALGAGLRVLANDWIALHLDVRDHMFESDLLGENKTHAEPAGRRSASPRSSEEQP